jgi:NAD(P)-dependent dehydrogenase (short-subunit alcohol dehydrogenase family)
MEMTESRKTKALFQVAGKGAVAKHYDRMTGKVAIITGAGQGIGRAAALLFAREHAKVVVADWNLTSGQETIEMIRQEGGEAIFMQCDVTREAGVKEMVEKAVETYGRLDSLVTNAGIYPVLGGIVETSEKDWHETVDVSLKGTYLCTKYAVPEMAKVGGGTVVNVASTYAIAADQGWGAYTAAKAGVIGITKACAVDYGHLNIRFNCVCPGGIVTEGVSTTNPYAPQQNYLNFYREGAFSTFDKERKYTEEDLAFINQHRWKAKPLGRGASAFELASVMLFLSCDDSSWVTGAIIPVDGGETSLIAGTVVRNLTETGAI